MGLAPDLSLTTAERTVDTYALEICRARTISSGSSQHPLRYAGVLFCGLLAAIYQTQAAVLLYQHHRVNFANNHDFFSFCKSLSDQAAICEGLKQHCEFHNKVGEV